MLEPHGPWHGQAIFPFAVITSVPASTQPACCWHSTPAEPALPYQLPAMPSQLALPQVQERLPFALGWPDGECWLAITACSSPCCLVRPTHAVFWRQPEAYYISACLHLETCHALCLLHPSLGSARRFEGGRRLCQGQPRRQQAEGAAPSTKAHIRPLQARQTPPTPMTG